MMLAGNIHRQFQRFPGPQQPVHDDGRDIGRGVGLGQHQFVIDGAQVPQQLFVQARHRLGHQRLDALRRFARGQQHRHFLRVGHHQLAAQQRARRFGAVLVAQGGGHRGGGTGAKILGPDSEFGVVLRQDQSPGFDQIGGAVRRHQHLTQPSPHRHHAGARDHRFPVCAAAARWSGDLRTVRRTVAAAKRCDPAGRCAARGGGWRESRHAAAPRRPSACRLPRRGQGAPPWCRAGFPATPSTGRSCRRTAWEACGPFAAVSCAYIRPGSLMRCFGRGY